MTATLKSIAAAVLIALAAPLSASADEVMVKGEVTKIDADAGKITIKHDPIKKYDMDAMTMVFRAGDPAMLKQVKPGDKVQFHPDKVNGQFTVTKIEKAK
jgi:Cu(I)/Ag(I) efflux system protein CusF